MLRKFLKDNTVIVIYMDVLIILSKAEGIEDLKLILQTASEYGLKLNIKKRNFFKRETDIFGYRVINDKLYPFPLQTKIVMNFPEPNCIDIQNYLGLTEYF